MREADWRLPGPSRFLNEAAAALKDGVVVLEVPPSRAGALVPSFRSAVEELGFASGGFFEVDAPLAMPPASAIVEMALPAGDQPDSPSPRAIMHAPGMDGVVCFIRPTLDEWRRWEPFVSGFLTERGNSPLGDPPSLVFLAPPGAGVLDKRARRFRFEGVVGRDEARLVFAAAARERPRSELQRLLAVELAVELAGWDLDAVRDLAGRKLDELLAPEFPETGLVDGAAVAWEAGSLDEFEGRPMACLGAILARRDRGELDRRIWRAQIRAVFPWLEEIRQEFIARHGKRLRLPIEHYDGYEINDPAALDWGQIHYAMKGRGNAKEMTWLNIMREVRNALAHREPVTFAKLMAAERDAPAILYG